MSRAEHKNKTNWKQYFFIIRELTGREIKRKYARSFLGIVWSVLQPLMTMIVLALVFTHMFSRKIENFPVYLMCGQVIWGMYSGATNSAMTSLVDNKTLLIKVKFPKVIFPISRAATALVNLGYSMIALILIMIFFRIKPNWIMLLFPIDILFLFLFRLGIGYILSILYVFFADIKHLYSVFLTMLMYCSAIFYSVDSLSPFMQKVVGLNPVYNYIYIMRCCMLHASMPEISSILMMVLWGIGVYLIGSYIFRRSQNAVMQVI